MSIFLKKLNSKSVAISGLKNEKRKKYNSEWVYSIKAVGILAVILGHIDNPLNTFIYSWHMPFFFLVSGFFIKKDADLWKLITKDWNRLMIPYFFFAVIAIVAESIKRLLLQREALDYIFEIKGILFWMDVEHLINSYAFVLWFLSALFFGKFIYYLVIKITSDLFFRCCIFASLFVTSFYIELPFALDNAMKASLWIFIGSLFYDNFKDSDKFRIGAMICSPIMLGSIYLFVGIPTISFHGSDYGDMILHILWVTSLLNVLICLVLVLEKASFSTNLLKWYGRETMVLFILHVYTNNIAHIFVEKIAFGGWGLKFAISLFLLQLVLIIKQRFSHLWFFKYV